MVTGLKVILETTANPASNLKDGKVTLGFLFVHDLTGLDQKLKVKKKRIFDLHDFPISPQKHFFGAGNCRVLQRCRELIWRRRSQSIRYNNSASLSCSSDHGTSIRWYCQTPCDVRKISMNLSERRNYR